MNGLLAVLAVMGALIGPPPTRAIQWASPVQREAFVYGPFPQCASGGWGSGKTFDYCLKAIEQIHPGLEVEFIGG